MLAQRVRAKLKSTVSVKSFSDPAKFDMLVLYLCGNRSPIQIARLMKFKKDTSVTLRNIRECARLIDLPLKQVRGRKR